MRAHDVTPGDAPYGEPPRPSASFFQGTRADERFRRQMAQETARATPLTPAERQLLAMQKRNRGVVLPQIRRIQLDGERERQRLEAEEYSRLDPIRVQDPLDPSTRDHLRRRAIQSRQRNKPSDPYLDALRPPGRSGPMPWDEEPQVITAPPGRNTPRHMLPW